MPLISTIRGITFFGTRRAQQASATQLRAVNVLPSLDQLIDQPDQPGQRLLVMLQHMGGQRAVRVQGAHEGRLRKLPHLTDIS